MKKKKTHENHTYFSRHKIFYLNLSGGKNGNFYHIVNKDILKGKY